MCQNSLFLTHYSLYLLSAILIEGTNLPQALLLQWVLITQHYALSPISSATCCKMVVLNPVISLLFHPHSFLPFHINQESQLDTYTLCWIQLFLDFPFIGHIALNTRLSFQRLPSSSLPRHHCTLARLLFFQNRRPIILHAYACTIPSHLPPPHWLLDLAATWIVSLPLCPIYLMHTNANFSDLRLRGERFPNLEFAGTIPVA